ncbi:MAG: 3-oxoadipate enol-lactonase [Pseudomonadota bacterium]|nr:3-oxoadipate enol-lactonase [Pseudomonadota bacterium]
MKEQLRDFTVNYEVSKATNHLQNAIWLTFSNSLATSLDMWESQVQYFRENYNILTYDTRGHGSSAATIGPYSLEMLADDVIELWDSLNIEKSHFIGLSLGGMIAQNLALNYPDRLLSVLICDSRADCTGPYRENWYKRIPNVEQNGLEILVDASIERWFTERFREENHNKIEQMKNMIRNTSVDGYVGCANAILDLDNLNKLAEINVPTGFIVGAQDSGTPPEAARAMHKKVQNARYFEIDPAAHISNVENPQAFNKIVKDFLNNIP